MVDSKENWNSGWCGWSTIGKLGFWLVRMVDNQKNRDSGWCGWSTVRKIGILGGADGRQLGKLESWGHAAQLTRLHERKYCYDGPVPLASNPGIARVEAHD